MKAQTEMSTHILIFPNPQQIGMMNIKNHLKNKIIFGFGGEDRNLKEMTTSLRMWKECLKVSKR